MLLINNLYGEYDSSTPEGRGANAAANLTRYFIEGRKLAEMKAKQLLKGEIDLAEACKNPLLENFTKAYIPYTEIDEETGKLNIEYGLAFAAIYIAAFDRDKDGALFSHELGPIGTIVDQIDNSGRITKSKLLAWLIFQDCIDVYNGVISPHETARSFMWASNDPMFVAEKLQDIYNRLELQEKEMQFELPEPMKAA